MVGVQRAQATVTDGSRPTVAVFVDDGGLPDGLEDAVALAEVIAVDGDEALASILPRVDAVFAWVAERRWIERVAVDAARMRWLQSSSDGVDHVLVPALRERDDVTVTNARGIFDDPIAEWVVGAMLAMVTGLTRSIVDQTARRWTAGRHTERLAGKRLLVVGPGPIGRATATRALALGMTVAAVGRSARLDALFGGIDGPERFHAALADADVVLDALPLTDDTRHVFDAAAFASMRRGARFINVGRGATVDQAALVEALRTDHLGGAALDVFESEPLPPDDPLWTLPNVIVSPHVAGDVEGYEEQTVALFLDNLGRFVRGEPLRNRVDVRAGFGIGDASA
jgi:phosphoglycerate dehydrogenase-like enzyme